MGRRNRRWDPPLPGPCTNRGPSMSESVSDDEKAGKPLAPLVELILAPPPEGEHPHARSVPFDRGQALAGLQAAFASLTDDEVCIARVWLLGQSRSDACRLLRMDEDTAQKLWRSMRRKLRDGLKQNDGGKGGG
jgi:DNA-directed RNA polymerase specialized sigma24 family protein